MTDHRDVELRAGARTGRDDLEGEPRGGDLRLVEQVLGPGDQLPVVDHAIRDIDRDIERGPAGLPLVEPPERVARDGDVSLRTTGVRST